MRLYYCKKCGTFIGSYGCDELCPTCRRKETYLTKEEVVAMLTDLQDELKHTNLSGAWKPNYAEGFNDSVATSVKKIQCRIDKLRG